MQFVSKVLWFVESHFRKDVALDEIAATCGVSRFHMCRLFAAVTGISVMEYLRGRRLTEAARQLSAGAPNILNVALDAGYGSHEAFTRAFRDRFGLTPDAVRKGAVIDQTLFVEPKSMEKTAIEPIELAEPRRERRKATTLVGLSRRYTYHDVAGIPAQWSDFQAFEGTLGERPGLWFGVCDQFNETEGTFRYSCAVEVENPFDLPADLTSIPMHDQAYLVFVHNTHIAELRRTLSAIWTQYMPLSACKTAEGQPILEVYDERFDARTGLGGLEIWVPIQPD